MPGAKALVPPAASTTRRSINWDVLRVVAVLMVVLYHATAVIPDNYQSLIPRNYEFRHQIGASLLLVISAFFVCASLRRHPTGRWWWGRVVRILPGFVAATLLAFTALHLLAPPGGPQPGLRALGANLLMLWNWDRSWGYLDGSYWTVPMQLIAFTAAALLWRTRWGTGDRLRLVLWVAVLLPIVQMLWKGAAPPLYGILVDGVGFHRAHLFVAGAAIFLWSRHRLSTPHFALLLAACAFGQLVHNSGFTPDGVLVTDRIAIAGVAAGMVLMALAARGPDWDRLVPAALHPSIRWLAGISFGVYLVHQTVGMALMRRLQEFGVGPTLQTGALVVNAVVLGWLMATYVERPAHKHLMALFDRVRGPRSAPEPIRVPERQPG